MSHGMTQLLFQIKIIATKQIKNEDFQREDGKHVSWRVDLCYIIIYNIQVLFPSSKKLCQIPYHSDNIQY